MTRAWKTPSLGASASRNTRPYLHARPWHVALAKLPGGRKCLPGHQHARIPRSLIRPTWRAPQKAFGQSAGHWHGCCLATGALHGADGRLPAGRTHIEKQWARNSDRGNSYEEAQESRVFAGRGDCHVRCGHAGPRIHVERRAARYSSGAVLRCPASGSRTSCLYSHARRASCGGCDSSATVRPAYLGLTREEANSRFGARRPHRWAAAFFMRRSLANRRRAQIIAPALRRAFRLARGWYRAGGSDQSRPNGPAASGL